MTMKTLPTLPLDSATSRAEAQKEIDTMLAAGFPKDLMDRILELSEPIGSFAEYENFIGEDDATFDLDRYNAFQAFFAESRKAGLDGSVPNAYGGSTIPSINNLNPYVNPCDVYDSMRGIKKEESQDTLDIFFAGHNAEEAIRRNFIYENNDRYQVWNCSVQWHNKEFPHFIADLDGLVIDRETGELGVLEIKHTISENYSTIRKFQENNPPKHYMAQTLGYMKAVGAKFGIIVCGWGYRVNEMSYCRIEMNDRQAHRLLSECEAFIKYNVETLKKPNLSKIKDFQLYKKACERIFGKEKAGSKPTILDKKYVAGFNAYLEKEKEVDEAKKNRLEAEKKEKKLKDELDALTRPFIAELGENTWGTIETEEGSWQINYKGTNTIDVDKLKADYPDVYDAFRKDGVNTTELKRARKDVYEDCRIIKDNSRRFSVRKVKDK